MEHVVLEIGAVMKGGGGLGNGKLKLTNERLIFERKKMFGGAGDVVSFPLHTIQSAQLVGVVTKTLKVRAGSTTVEFTEGITDTAARLKAMSDRLQQAIAGSLPSPSSSASTAAPPAAETSSEQGGNGWLGELERLAKLHEAGALTDEEFTAAKKRLLP